jgi:hypothetical protein
MKPYLRTCPWLLALALAGCGGDPAVRLVPVRGRATLGDKGLGRVTIQLVPDRNKGTHAPAGVGQTDADGSFHLTTPPHGDGAVPGHYKVTVTSYRQGSTAGLCRPGEDPPAGRNPSGRAGELGAQTQKQVRVNDRRASGSGRRAGHGRLFGRSLLHRVPTRAGSPTRLDCL